MKKRITTFLVALVLSNMLTPGLSRASIFSDVPDNDPHLVAIEYLKAKGIIQGYPDGSFQPDRVVSRVEFLKLALETYNIQTDVTAPSGFKDVDENAWYAPFVKKAKQQGWIQGYPDGTFKPAQDVNKVEGIKMLGKIANWAVAQNITDAEKPFLDTAADAWYTPYILYAKQKNFLEDRGQYFIPSASLFRGQVSEILFRNLITNETKNTVFTDDLKTYALQHLAVAPVITEPPTPPVTITPPPIQNPPVTPPPSNFESVTYQTYQPSFFDNITLNDTFPNIFYVNEVYYLEGSIKTGTYQKAFAFLKNTADSTIQNFATDVTNNTFKIRVIFKNAGNYSLGIIPGDSGQSKVAPISVLAALPNPGAQVNTQIPASQKVEYKNQQTAFTWDNGTNNLSELVISQDNQSKTYFFRQNKNSFNIDYGDFSNFHNGTVNFQIKTAKSSQTKPLSIDTPWATGANSNFTTTTHTFSETHNDQITYNTLPETLNTTGVITLSGTAKTDIFQEAAVTKPNGLVEIVSLTTNQPTTDYYGSKVIASGNNYTFNYNATQAGTYIVEINGENGAAVINTPVYIQEGIPFIPDFFDLINSDQLITNFDLNNLRNQLLNLVNQERTTVGFKAINADTDLNTLAQNHADDMALRNFFGHVNPDGKTPDDRRLALNIPTEVGENLAKSPNLLYAHNGLMRSPEHRKNLLDPDWERVGIGIAKDSDGGILVVEEFSTYPLTPTKLATIKTDLLTAVNNKRASAGIGLLTTNATLSSVADQWTNEMIQQNFFDFTAPDGSSLTSLIQKAGINKAVQILILESNSTQKISDQLSGATDSTNPKWSTIGLGLNVDATGLLVLTALYSN